MSFKVATQASPSADGVFASVTPGSTNQVAVHSVASVMNDTGAAAIRRHNFGRFTGGNTPTAVTPEKNTTRSAAANSTGASIWSTTPTISGNPLVIQIVPQDSGGTNAFWRRWTPPHPRYLPTEMPSGSTLGINQASSSGIVISGTIGFEEGCERYPRQFRGRRSTKPGYVNFSDWRLSLTGVATTPKHYAASPSVLNMMQVLDWDVVPEQQWNINLFGGGAPPPATDDNQFLMTMGCGG